MILCFIDYLQSCYSLFLLRNTKSSWLNVTLFDKNVFNGDGWLGNAEISIADLQKASSGQLGKAPILVPVPLYLPHRNQSSGSRSQRLYHSATCLLEMQFISWSGPASGAMSAGVRRGRLPKGATEGAEWRTLLKELLGSIEDKKDRFVLAHEGMHQACCMKGDETDTQLGVFIDSEARQVVVTFRGTEQSSIKDILTDINIIQSPFYTSAAGAMVHSGFLQAYLSVRDALLQGLEMILTGSLGLPWSVYITGHSLGGALATLLAYDLDMIRRGDGEDVDALRSRLSSDFVTQLRRADIVTYTFGAPRVGNQEFVDSMNSLLRLCGEKSSLFRVVNKEDIVARMPRSSRVNGMLVYEHVGKTVMIDDTADPVTGQVLWIDGESKGECPLLDLSPLANVNARMNSLADDLAANAEAALLEESAAVSSPSEALGKVIAGLQSTFAAPSETLDGLLSGLQSPLSSMIPVGLAENLLITDLTTPDLPVTSDDDDGDDDDDDDNDDSADEEAIGALTSGEESVVSTPETPFDFHGIPIGELQKAISGLASDLQGGVDAAFVEREVKILRSILEGRALDHHLEGSYFKALKFVVESKMNLKIPMLEANDELVKSVPSDSKKDLV